MEVEYMSKTKGFLAKPDNPNGKGLILIHEFWGLNQQMKNLASKFAEVGYSALAINLYGERVAKNVEEARAIKDSVVGFEAVRNIQQAINYFSSLKISAERVAVIGYCMGGGFAFKAATNGVHVGVYGIYYGQVKDDSKILSTIQSPLLGIFGGLDQSIPKSLVESFDVALTKLGKRHEIYIYDEAGHAFANEERPNYNKKSADDAWRKTLSFLNKYL